LTRPRRARHAPSHPVRFVYDKLQFVPFQFPTSRKLVVQKKKAAEPGREALAAFPICKGHARRLVSCVAVTFGWIQTLRLTRAFYLSRFEDLSRLVLAFFRDGKRITGAVPADLPPRGIAGYQSSSSSRANFGVAGPSSTALGASDYPSYAS